MIAWLLTGLVFGLGGLLVECIFTGSKALIDGDRAGTCKTYLVMVPLYSAAGLALKALKGLTGLPVPVEAALFVVPIFAFEFSYGWLLKRVFGYCPWDYGDVKWSVKGLIRLDYAGYWWLLALLFYPISAVFERALMFLLTTP